MSDLAPFEKCLRSWKREDQAIVGEVRRRSYFRDRRQRLTAKRRAAQRRAARTADPRTAGAVMSSGSRPLVHTEAQP